MIAVIVPAHNEQKLIGRCLRSILRAAQHRNVKHTAVVPVVALDRCTDDTAAICHEHGVPTLQLDAGCVGVARARAAAWSIAQGAQWIASTDADSEVPSDWLARQVACNADAFCGVVRVTDWEDYGSHVRRSFARGEMVCDGHPHVHGANLGVSASAYRAAGGFPPLACGEDVALVAALEATGHRIARLARPRVVTSARRQARAVGGFSDFLKTLEARTPEPVPTVRGLLAGLSPDPEAAW